MFDDWQFSRTNRRHCINDGEMYQNVWYLWEIRNCTPYGQINQLFKEGYDLYHKGKLIKHAKTVKELKRLVKVANGIDTHL